MLTFFMKTNGKIKRRIKKMQDSDLLQTIVSIHKAEFVETFWEKAKWSLLTILPYSPSLDPWEKVIFAKKNEY